MLEPLKFTLAGDRVESQSLEICAQQHISQELTSPE